MTGIEKILLCCGLWSSILVVGYNCRPANEPGSMSISRVTNFLFFQRIANPCEISAAAAGASNSASSAAYDADTDTSNNASDSTNRIPFLQLVETDLGRILRTIQLIEAEDSITAECNGNKLDSLPVTPPLDNFTLSETLKQTYKSGIFLNTHFQLMSLDRQLASNGVYDQPEDELLEPQDVPLWRFRLCGKESPSLKRNLEELATQMEDALCTIMTGASREQRASFRGAMNQLLRTPLQRYHTSCSLLRQRDCIVLRQAKPAVNLLLRKFQALSLASASGENNKNNEDNFVNNNL